MSVPYVADPDSTTCRFLALEAELLYTDKQWRRHPDKLCRHSRSETLTYSRSLIRWALINLDEGRTDPDLNFCRFGNLLQAAQGSVVRYKFTPALLTLPAAAQVHRLTLQMMTSPASLRGEEAAGHRSF